MIETTSFAATSSPSTPYTRRELGLILLREKNYTINPNPNRYVDISLLAELVSNHIISSYAADELINNNLSLAKDDLSAWISTVIFEAECDIAVTISALTQINEYQQMMLELGEDCIYEVDEVHYLFLSAFMVAARAIHDEQSYLTYWTRVAGYEYSTEELCVMERSFVDMMFDWCKQVDEDTLYASDSDIINSNGDLDDLTLDKKKSAHFITILSSTSSSSLPSSSSSQLKHVPSMTGEREARLMRTSEIMTEGLKASARRWDPLHAHCSWFAEVDHSTPHAEPKYNVCEDEKHPILNRVSSDECREAQLLTALEAASWRLKKSARKTSLVYARTSWCSRTTTLL